MKSIQELSFAGLRLVFFLLMHSTCSQAQQWYLNDNSNVNDVFTTQVGKPNHHGNSPDQPLHSLAEILKRCKEGDTIYIDTGSYPEFNTSGEILITLPKNVVIIHFSQKEVYPKKQYPTTLKATAEEFFILNDQPVSREVYLQHLQKK
jgi:hypothetical protein